MKTFDKDGRLHVAKARISKANVCPYRGSEIPGWEGELGLDPGRIYHLLRDPDELRAAAPTFAGVQVLRKHVPVSAEDHQPWEIVGATGTDVAFSYPYLRASLVIWAKDAIDDIESAQKKQLSAAYYYSADLVPGTFQGQPYDGVMRNICGNHIALVSQGRAGRDCVVGDAAIADFAARWPHAQRIGHV